MFDWVDEVVEFLVSIEKMLEECQSLWGDDDNDESTVYFKPLKRVRELLKEHELNTT